MAKKKNKKLVVLLALALISLVSVAGYTTYARYIAKGAGAAGVEVAKWAVKLDGTNVTTSSPITLTKTLDWTGGNGLEVKDGKIAPGMSTSAGLTIDPTDSEVGMYFYVKVGTTNLNNANIAHGTLVAGKCAAGAQTCTSDAWTNVPMKLVEEGTYAGYYVGHIALPNDGVMTGAEKIYFELPVEWTDGYPDETANTNDTALGVAAPTNGTITFDVVVEQAVTAIDTTPENEG